MRLIHLFPFSEIQPSLDNLSLPFPGCLYRELKGVFEDWLGGAGGWGLPLGIREDTCVGGGIWGFEILGLCRASLVPFGIALSAGD